MPFLSGGSANFHSAMSRMKKARPPHTISFVAGTIGFGAFWQSAGSVPLSTASFTHLATSEYLGGVVVVVSCAWASPGLPRTTAKVITTPASRGITTPANKVRVRMCRALTYLSRKTSTKPNRASASVKAIPRNIVVRTMPAASG